MQCVVQCSACVCVHVRVHVSVCVHVRVCACVCMFVRLYEGWEWMYYMCVCLVTLRQLF